MHQTLLESAPATLNKGIKRAMGRTIGTSGVAGVVLLLLAVFMHVRFGSVVAGLDFLAGERLIVDSRAKDFGELSDGSRTVVFRVMNFTGKQVTILGSRSNCTCLNVEQLPKRVPAASRAELTVTVRKGRKVGVIDEAIRFYTDDAQTGTLLVRVTGHIAE